MKPENEVNNLLESIDYQEGSIVSKIFIDKGTGSVTLFAFDKDQKLSEHTAPFDAMVYIIDGEAEIMVAGTKSIVKKGQVIIMPANKPHALKAVERFKMMLIMIKS
jgi:quercetin dioxygenase-like cupin family protein